jgi:hypothetical protein
MLLRNIAKAIVAVTDVLYKSTYCCSTRCTCAPYSCRRCRAKQAAAPSSRAHMRD